MNVAGNILDWSREACEFWKIPLPSIVFNRRLKTTAGRAFYKKGLVELNPRLWERMSEEERRNTLFHEIAHIAAYLIHGETGHGYHWKKLMLDAGENPSVYHNFDVSGIKNYHTVRCDCKEHSVGPIQYNRILKGRKYRCKLCKSFVRLDNQENPQEMSASA